MDEKIAYIKSHHKLHDVVAQYITVNDDDIVICPFHDENTSSMKLYDDHYHCFGCNAHGDVIDFVSRMEGITISEAIRQMSAGFNVGVHRIARRLSREDAIVKLHVMELISGLRKLVNMYRGGAARDNIRKTLDALYYNKKIIGGARYQTQSCIQEKDIVMSAIAMGSENMIQCIEYILNCTAQAEAARLAIPPSYGKTEGTGVPPPRPDPLNNNMQECVF